MKKLLSIIVLFLVLMVGVASGAYAQVSGPSDAFTDGPSLFCHETDGIFTSCADGNMEWSDIQASFFDVFADAVSPDSALYVDQADKDPERSIPNGSGIDTLMLMYDEILRTTPLDPSETVHVHFMTTDEGKLVHYDVFIGTGGIQRVLINGVLQDPMPSGISGMAGFGPSQNNSTSHVMAEFQIGLEAAGFTSEECCYSPDPAWWGSSVPSDPQECEGDRDCDGIPDSEDLCPGTPGDSCQPDPNCPPHDFDCDQVDNELDQCPLEPGTPENQGCPDPRHGLPGEEASTTAGIFTANLDGTTSVDPEPLLPVGEEPALCESIGRIVDFQVPPTGTYRNHGEYMRLVAQLAESLVNSQVAAGLITPQEAEELQGCVVSQRARSSIGKP